jgi:hypothetical protein
MTDQLEADTHRAHKAAQILGEPLVVEAFTVLRQEIYDRWQSSPARDADGREKLFLMLKAADRVHAHLASVIETGKLAQATLKQKMAQAAGLNSALF